MPFAQTRKCARVAVQRASRRARLANALLRSRQSVAGAVAVAPPPATRSVVELPPPPVMQPPSIAAQPPSVAVPPSRGRAPAAHLEVQEGSGGTVVYERDAPGAAWSITRLAP